MGLIRVHYAYLDKQTGGIQDYASNYANRGTKSPVFQTITLNPEPPGFRAHARAHGLNSQPSPTHLDLQP